MLAELVADGGTTLIDSEQLAQEGKTTYDLGVVTNEFADEYPDIVQTWVEQQDRAVKLIRDDPDAAAAAVAAELNLEPAAALAQMKDLIFLDAAEQAAPDALGGGLGAALLRRRRSSTRSSSRSRRRRTSSSTPTRSTPGSPRRWPRGERAPSTASATSTVAGARPEVDALGPLDLEVGAGEFVAIVGPSGCGKSTLLSLLAGFQRPTAGAITVDGRPVRAPGPDRGVVFQHPNLYPWLSVRDNVAFGLRMRGVAKRERQAAADAQIARVGLAEFADAPPYELSGGMQQRCQIARMLASEPEIMLLDEPFGALDALTREQMQAELHGIWRESGRTALFITHSVEEAAFLGTRVLVMSERPGRIVLRRGRAGARAAHRRAADGAGVRRLPRAGGRARA